VLTTPDNTARAETEGISSEQPSGLERGLGLKEAVALNMIEIVGIGPFVVTSLVIKAMGGPQALIAWVAGAVLATLDAFVWSELGAAMPRAGGTYVFLREAYGPGRWGRLMSFLFVWQTFVQAPLSIASASIGFARYAGYLHPLSTLQAKAVSGGLVLFLIVLLYRRITTIGKISVLLWAGVVGTLLWLIWGGASHFNAKMAFDFPPGAFSLSWVWSAGLGAAMVNTVYSYWGYYNICHLGGALAGSAELEIYCEHVRREVVRCSRGASGHLDGSVDRARFGVLGFAGIFARAVFRRAGRKFLPDIRTAAPHKTLSVRIAAGAWRARFPFQCNFEAGDRHRRHSRHAPDRAVHRPGGGSDLVAATLGIGAIAVQNVALPVACSANDIRVGLALLADRYSEKMGTGRNRAGRARISYLGP
jgi:hypothetical protein